MCKNCDEKNIKKSNIEIKSVNADFDELNNKGEFVFTASSERMDREGDVIKSDGWVLDNFKDGGVLLWGHDQNKLPVGRVLWVKQDDGNLLGKARFNRQTQLSKDVEKLVRIGDLTGISVGFRALESEKTPEGIMFNKQELLEVSVVNVPANPDAVIHTIKNLDLQSENVKLSVLDSMGNYLKKEKKETVDECVDRKIPIILEENPDMEDNQAVAIAESMCKEKQTEVEEKEKADCPMGNPDCANYSKDEKQMQEILERLEKLEKLNEEKNNSTEKVETDLRKQKTNEIIRRAVSQYLQNKK